MTALAFDENFNNNVLRGLLRRNPTLDVARVQDAGLAGRNDPAVLAWAATEQRILVSHDVSTLTAYNGWPRLGCHAHVHQPNLPVTRSYLLSR